MSKFKKKIVPECDKVVTVTVLYDSGNVWKPKMNMKPWNRATYNMWQWLKSILKSGKFCVNQSKWNFQNYQINCSNFFDQAL